jgi:hypothetical protein
LKLFSYFRVWAISGISSCAPQAKNLSKIKQKITYNILHLVFFILNIFRKKNPYTLLVGMQTSVTTLEKNLEAS